MTPTDIIFHHFDASPFSEKVRLAFGLKGMAWRSVRVSPIMPRPDLMPLTGGYRRTPTMQIGADIFCDTRIILSEIEARYPSAERIGFARLTTMAFEGADLRPLRDELLSKLAAGKAQAGEGLDLSLITQLLGDKPTGMAIQAEVLGFHQLYRSPCSSEKPTLRVLALAAAIDMGGNTPIEFLLENSGVELQTLYVVDGVDLPSPLPDHDVAIVIASDSEECIEALRKIDSMAPHWPRSPSA